MKRNFTFLLAAFALIFSLAIPTGVWGQTRETVTDNMTATNLTATGTTYTAFSNVSLASDAIYAGKSAKDGSGNIQLRSSGSDCGIVSTTSGGKIKSVKITVASGTKTIDVYGSNTPYTSAADLYATSGNANQGTKLGSLTSTGTINVTGDYAYVGIRSNNGAVYISKIEFTWDNAGGTPTPTTPCDLALTSASVSLSFDLFNNATAQVIRYTTSSTGTVYVESNDYVNASVNQDAKTITVTPKAITNGSAQTITIRQNADLTYLAGSAQFTVNITDSTPAPTYIFNTDEGLQALNITIPNSNAGTNLEENHNYISGDVTMTITHGTTNTRVWGGTSATDLRVYGGGGSLTFSVPSGQQITSIILVGEKPSNFNEIGSKAEHTATWNGTPSRTVTLTANNTCQINTITVVYEANASGVDTPVLPASCNFQTEKEITITGITEGATVYYTTDNTDPKTSNTRVEYTAPFTINATTTVKAVAYLNSNYSYVAEATYTRVYNITVVQTTGGTISANLAQAAAGTTIELTATANIGYAFGSWSVTPSSVTVASNQFTMPASDVTVTATFTTATAYTVSFSVNNKIEMTATVNSGNSIDLTKFVAEGDGYTFEGWSTTAGGENIDPQNAYIPTGNITLYPGVAPAPSGDEYTLVTNVNQLEAGNLVVIAANGSDNYAMSTTQNNNNRGKSNSIEKSSDYSKLSITGDDVCELTLGTSNNHWTLYDATNNGYLYAVSGQNYLRTRTDNSNDACGEWTIAISNNNATISSQGTTDVRDLKYNASSSIFSCYKSGQQTVYLYTKPASKSAKGKRDGVPTTSKVTGIAANVLVTVKSNGVVYLTGSNAGNAANLVVEDGGQLVTSADVQGTMQKTILGYDPSANPSNGWYFISSSLKSSVNVSDVQNLINASGTDYDLYYFKQNPDDGLEWINQKNNNGFTELYEKTGYLYANAAQTTTLGFAGMLRKNDNSEQVSKNLAYYDSNVDENMHGWNLVGNPFPSYAKVDRAFFRMKNTNDGINPEAVPANSVINPTEGVFVHASQTNEEVTFTATTTTGSKNRLINIDVARQGEMLDNAIVSLNAEGSLCKLVLNENTTRVYFHQDEKDYAILASSSENEVPVSFKASRNGSYTITVKPEDVEMNYLHLIDNMTGADVDLLANPSYTFEAKKTDYKSRFRLVFSANSIDEASTSSSFAHYNGTGWTVTNEGEATLQVVDVTGRIVSSEAINGCANININAANGVYMLRLVNGNNVKTQKIVVK